MKLQFVLAAEDVVAFNLFHIHHSPTVRRNFWIQIGWGMAILILLFGYSSWEEKRLFPIMIGLAVSPLLFLLIWWLWQKQIRRNIQNLIAEGKNRGVFGPKEIEVANGQVIERSDGRMSAVDVRFVERVVVTGAHLFIYNSATSAFVVPRAFVSDEELDDFLDALNETCPDLRQTPASSTGITEFVKEHSRDRFG